MSRRSFLKLVPSLFFSPFIVSAQDDIESILLPILDTHKNYAKSKYRVVVLGGGIAGIAFCKTLIKLYPDIEIVLIEPKQVYQTCFMSNQYIVGQRSIDTMLFGYDEIVKSGIKHIKDSVVSLAPVNKEVYLKSGSKLYYDKLVVALGIDFELGAITGSNAGFSEYPHGWIGDQSTNLLRKRIAEIPNGDDFIISVPAAPFRCPPGPYERASLIANYFKKVKPKSRVIIYDANESFSKEELFKEAWEKLFNYGSGKSQIEWISKSNGGSLTRVDPASGVLEFEGASVSTNWVNIIWPQTASKVALQAGLGFDNLPGFSWCPVNPLNMESNKHQDIHIIGDSSFTSMPKSAFSAYSQAVNCAVSIASNLADKDVGTLKWMNTCYSVVSNNYAFSVSGVYEVGEAKSQHVKVYGAYTPPRSPSEVYKQEFKDAHKWYANFTHAVFG